MVGEKILLIDDEEDIRDILSISLSDIGYEVITAENGEDALRIFRSVKPPIVLTDIRMPGMDGIELLRKIKQEDPDTEVIMLTGHGDMDLAIQSLKHEATDFVTKPINDDVLEIALKRAHERLTMRQRLREYTQNLQNLVHEQAEKLVRAERLIAVNQVVEGLSSAMRELVLEISAEIGEVHRLQEELRVTQQRYQQLFDEAPCYISVQDRDLQVSAANRCFTADFGNAIGHHCYEVYKHRDESCPNCPVVKTFEEGKSRQHETVVTSLKGEQRNVLIWTAPIRNASGDIARVMEMSTDITEVRRLQDRLTSLGLLMGSISHGVKGLLTGLDGGIYRVETGLEKGNPDRIREGWDAVKLTVACIRNMVQDLLHYAKETDLNRERINASDFASDLAVVFEQKIRNQPIVFASDIANALGEFEGDAGALSSALLNILENAMDACSEDRSKASHKILFKAERAGEDILFDVSDNGVGMGKEALDRLFTPSFSSKGRKGTGLGLFISHEIVRRHGGTITVESSPSEGSHFCIRIPGSFREATKSVPERPALPGQPPQGL